jgi:hypothetical protein
MMIKVCIQLTRAEVVSIARVLEADATGVGYLEEDGEARDDVLRQVVGKAAVEHNIDTPETRAVVQREYREWRRGQLARVKR